jgi:hypothetical protein
LFIFWFLLPSDLFLSSDASPHRLALGSGSSLEPVASASVSAGAGSLLAAMPPPKPTPSWFGGFGLKKVVAK